MKSSTISIVGKNIGEKPTVESLEHTLESMQRRVREDGATLDVVRFADGVIMWVDDEGLLNGSAPNLVIINDGSVISQINGNVFFTGTDGADTIGLSEKQSKAIVNSFKEIDYQLQGRGNLYTFVVNTFESLLKE